MKNKKIQKLMYKDTRMDIWNLNYFTYWGENKLLPERKNKYAIVYFNLLNFRRYNIIYGWSSGEQLLDVFSIYTQKINLQYFPKML